jgi:hypothetical protein
MYGAASISANGKAGSIGVRPPTERPMCGLLQAQTEQMAALLPALQAAIAELTDMRKQGAEAAATLDVAKLRSGLRADAQSDLRAELRTFVESINE